MTYSEILLGLPGYQVIAVERAPGGVRIRVRYVGPRSCPHCGGTLLRSKGWVRRSVRHEDWGQRDCQLELEAPKAQRLACGRHFRQPLPGILPWQRASEAFRRAIFQQHLDGINRSRLARREGIGAATVQRYFQHGLQRQAAQWQSLRCPKYLGLDEHFFTRRHGYATTLCHLGRHKVFDVVLGRSEASLDAYFQRLEGKQEVELVCIDLASHYRALVRKHFPNARIVADRFHVIRLVNHHFLACWRELDPAASRNRGLLRLMRRHRHPNWVTQDVTESRAAGSRKKSWKEGGACPRRGGCCGCWGCSPPRRLCGMMRAMEAAAAGRRRSHATGLRTIAFFEASKGLLVLLVALGVAEFFHGNLEDTAAHLLFRLHISPERRLGRVLLEAAAKLSDAGLVQLALIAMAYSAARFIEAWGLWRGRAWAQWFAVLSGLLYLPWEFGALLAKPDWIRGGLLAGNILLVLYIARLRLAARHG